MCIVMLCSADHVAEDTYVSSRVDRFINTRWFIRYNHVHRNGVMGLIKQIRKTEAMIEKIKASLLMKKNPKERKQLADQLNKLRLQAIELSKALNAEVSRLIRHRRVARRLRRRQNRKIRRFVRIHLRRMLKSMRRDFRNHPEGLTEQFNTEARRLLQSKMCKGHRRVCKRVIKKFVRKAERVQMKMERKLRMIKHQRAVGERKVKRAVKDTLYHFEKNYKDMDKNHFLIKSATMQRKLY